MLIATFNLWMHSDIDINASSVSVKVTIYCDPYYIKKIHAFIMIRYIHILRICILFCSACGLNIHEGRELRRERGVFWPKV